MSRFSFRLSHDRGATWVGTWATDIDTARSIVLNTEGAPRSAIRAEVAHHDYTRSGPNAERRTRCDCGRGANARVHRRFYL